MPSFDVVSEVEMHEVTNGVDQANREVSTRFDFKGTNASFELNDSVITMKAQADFQLQQMLDVFYNKASKRGIDLESFEVGEAEERGKRAYQKITVKQGIDKEIGKKIVKKMKDEKMKVQASIQGDQVRVTGKKRDDLQQAISMLKEAGMGIPLQFQNFRD